MTSKEDLRLGPNVNPVWPQSESQMERGSVLMMKEEKILKGSTYTTTADAFDWL